MDKVRMGIQMLDEFCQSQERWCGNCPIGTNASQEWLDWGCPIIQLIDDTQVRNALERSE